MAEPDPKRFRVDYVYGPYVGRTYIEGSTLAKAAARLWDKMGHAMWVVPQFRHVTEVKS